FAGRRSQLSGGPGRAGASHHVRLPSTIGGVMRAAVWNDKGSLDVVDRPVPEPKPGWVRIAVSSVGICGTDLHFFSGSFGSPAGLLPGLEVGGFVDVGCDGVERPALAVVAADAGDWLS